MRNMDFGAGIESCIANEIMHVHRRLIQRCTRAMEKLNIGVGQMPILKLLAVNESMTQRQIAEEVRVTPATICGTLKRMERSGLIRRTSTAEDGRVSCVSLTEEGRKRCREAQDMLSAPYSHLFDGFSESERRQLHDFVLRLGRNLSDAAEDENGK